MPRFSFKRFKLYSMSLVRFASFLSRFTKSTRIIARVLGDGVLKLKGRYPEGTANKVGVGVRDVCKEFNMLISAISG